MSKQPIKTKAGFPALKFCGALVAGAGLFFAAYAERQPPAASDNLNVRQEAVAANVTPTMLSAQLELGKEVAALQAQVAIMQTNYKEQLSRLRDDLAALQLKTALEISAVKNQNTAAPQTNAPPVAAPAKQVPAVASPPAETTLAAIAPKTALPPAKAADFAQDKLTLADAAKSAAALKEQTAAATALTGEVWTYNADSNRVYISLGSANAGLEPRRRFSVWRDGQYVTDIRVVEVFSVTSACEVEGATPIGLLPGDIAKAAAN